MADQDIIFTSTSTYPGDPGFPERNGQAVTVLRPLTLNPGPDVREGEVDMDVGPMFRVRFADGVETDAYGDELTPEPLHPQLADFTAYMLAGS